MAEEVMNRAKEKKNKNNRLKGARVLVEDVKLKDTGNWFDTEYINVGERR